MSTDPGSAVGPTQPEAMTVDPLAVRALYEQLHAFRAHVDTINPEDREGPDLPGSGISALISEFDGLLHSSQEILSARPGLAALVRRVASVPQIRTGLLDASYPRDVRIAKETLLVRTNLLIQAVGQLLQNLHLAGGWEVLLHDSVRAAALQQFRNGHWRDAQLNAVMAVFELIRMRTGQQSDGDALVTRTFSLSQPLLTVGDLNTPSGRDEQVGFMTVLQGIYKGTRNPRAHSLVHDLNDLKAAQYLVFASLLARRIAEATAVTPGAAPAATAP
jgi:uncharacterized protein (TIGR02391 family)